VCAFVGKCGCGIVFSLLLYRVYRTKLSRKLPPVENQTTPTIFAIFHVFIVLPSLTKLNMKTEHWRKVKHIKRPLFTLSQASHLADECFERNIQSGPKVGIQYTVYNYCNTAYLLLAHSVSTV
jgi:hypothetical protein